MYELLQAWRSKDKKFDKAAENSNHLKKESYLLLKKSYLLSKENLLKTSKELMENEKISESNYLDIKRLIRKSLIVFKQKSKNSIEDFIETQENLLNSHLNEDTRKIIERNLEIDKKLYESVSFL